MNFRLLNYISLPPGDGPGSYGRPAFHQGTARLYIPLVDDDALGVVDCIENKYLHAIPGLPGTSAAVTTDQADVLLATSPGSSAVAAIRPGEDLVVATLTVGGVPEELAYDPSRGHLLVTFAERPEGPPRFRVAVVDVQRQKTIGDVQMPGSTRQVLYDRQSDMFYVLVAEPAQILVLDAENPTRVAHAFDVIGTHGLRSMVVGPRGTRLFCASDDSLLITIDRRSGRPRGRAATIGLPDSILYNPAREHLYVAIGERGLIEVFDTALMTWLGSEESGPGAAHLALDRVRHQVYALLPKSRQVAVYEDMG